MTSGFRGTYVISWAQTEIDGLRGAHVDDLTIGARWLWRGEAVRLDGPSGLLSLGDGEGAAEMRRRAAQKIRRIVGPDLPQQSAPQRQGAIGAGSETGAAAGEGFVVTDGRRLYAVALVSAPGEAAVLLRFDGEVPPVATGLYVVERALGPGQRRLAGLAAGAWGAGSGSGGVICFTPGTRIATEAGARAVEDLCPGDRIATRDNGLQEVLWRGMRRISGARLHAMPALRPIRLRAGAIGEDRPDADLVVSPGHRVLMRGPCARALFNEDEVLVAAADLVNDRTILVEAALREVTYVHILTRNHQIIWANGIETETFHPASAALELIDAGQRQALFECLPEVAHDPRSYGDYARRNLTAPEAAILRYATAA